MLYPFWYFFIAVAMETWKLSFSTLFADVTIKKYKNDHLRFCPDPREVFLFLAIAVETAHSRVCLEVCVSRPRSLFHRYSHRKKTRNGTFDQSSAVTWHFFTDVAMERAPTYEI